MQQAAEEHKIPLENMLVESIELMFGDLPANESPESLEKLPDEQLWRWFIDSLPFHKMLDCVN